MNPDASKLTKVQIAVVLGSVNPDGFYSSSLLVYHPESDHCSKVVHTSNKAVSESLNCQP